MAPRFSPACESANRIGRQERTKAGLDAVRREGRIGGRRPKPPDFGKLTWDLPSFWRKPDFLLFITDFLRTRFSD